VRVNAFTLLLSAILFIYITFYSPHSFISWALQQLQPAMTHSKRKQNQMQSTGRMSNVR